ncbi:Bug family tripartite tricarboxylate transporter substrate binding protein [Phreatobacter stygius]|uniref:Tripartite tricarboxylate transporter substrate binding protein n=1 Tax=Phreatobacter stygius TaxID=1940610 RepID=A0A4D7BII9_9HYPH|nr:tripartite tricarboxylate transporter substrate binding protein [Phreatobacter stygius]QCI67597.1 tripartite tricarboxylate transporter substrate binding protein [Phreatobacter stygius]
MPAISRRRIVQGLALGGLATSARPGAAQGFPSRTVTIVSPYQAGGTSDIIARMIAQKLGEAWRQPVIVENRPGANGGVGATAVARAAADGHTLLATASSALTLNPLLYRSLGYDVARDFAPVTRTGSVPNVVVVNPAVPATTLAELIALAKARPDSISYGSQGNGSNGHLNGELFKQMTGVTLVHVPYRGSAPAVSDLIGGQIQLMFDNLPSVIEQIRAGKLRALAVTTAGRSPFLPDVPGMAEAGLAGFDTSAWFAVMLPKETPAEIRGAIERGVIAALTDADARQKLAHVGVTVMADGAAALGQQIEAETALWRAVIAKARISIE